MMIQEYLGIIIIMFLGECMPKAKCPVCGTTIEIEEDYTPGDIIECPNCGTQLIIVRKGKKIYLDEFEEFEEEETEENEY